MYSHATSFSTISSVITFLFIACLTSRACCAGSQKHPAQQQAQPQLQSTGAAAPSQGEELLRQLLTLTANGNQPEQQSGELARDTKELKFVADGFEPVAAKGKKQLTSEKAKQKKLALKRKLHKLVDEIVDESEEADEVLKVEAARRRTPLQTQQVQQDSKEAGLVMVMKRQPLEESGNNNNNNELGDILVGQQQPQQPRRPVNLNEHARSILDDSFGIRRDSVFTTNNHLGLKGVPKFGSDEQF